MNDERILKLQKALPTLSASNVEFAGSLILQHNDRGKLSDKQWFWVEKLAADAGKPQPEPKSVEGNFKPLWDMLTAASASLKYPKIRMTTEGGSPIRLSLAGPRSKYRGDVMVSDGGPFGSNVWYGRINPEGAWFIPFKSRCGHHEFEAVANALREMVESPADVAAAYGQRYGSCCFCGKELTTKESVSAGYGPICAGKWGLPWGEINTELYKPKPKIDSPPPPKPKLEPEVSEYSVQTKIEAIPLEESKSESDPIPEVV